jgi:hypothetical protein
LVLEPSEVGFDTIEVEESAVDKIYKVVGNLKMI